MGTLTRIASGSIAATLPIFVTVQASLLAASSGLSLASTSLSAMVTAMLPDVAARLAGALQVSATLVIPGIVGDVTAKIQQLTSLIASLTAGLSLVPPTGAITAIGTIIAQLGAAQLALEAAAEAVGTIGGQLNIVASLLATINSITSAAGVDVYLYQGDGADFGAAITASGIASMTGLYSPIIVVQSSNAGAVQSLNTVFGI